MRAPREEGRRVSQKLHHPFQATAPIFQASSCAITTGRGDAAASAKPSAGTVTRDARSCSCAPTQIPNYILKVTVL